MTGPELIALAKKNPISVGCGALALVLGVAVYFRGGGLPEAERALEEKSSEGQRLSANVKNGAQLAEQLAALVAADKELAVRLVRAGQLVNNTQYFYRLVADTGVSLVDFRQNPPPGGKAASKGVFAPVGFSITVQGEYVQLIAFLRHLEGGAHFSRVLAATVNGPGNNAGGGVGARSTIMTMALSFDLLGLP